MSMTSDQLEYERRRQLELQQRNTRLTQAMYDATLKNHVRDPNWPQPTNERQTDSKDS
jgi:hypothetical protein